MSEESDFSPYAVTLKAGAGYDAPWIVLRAHTPDAMFARLNAVQDSLGAFVIETAAALKAVYNVADGLGGTTVSVETTNPAPPVAPAPVNHFAQPVTPSPVAAAPAAPAGAPPAPRCAHGERKFKSGSGAKGPWSAWFCALPQGSADACKPEWV